MQSPTAFPTISGFVYDLLKRFSLDNFTLYSLKEDPLDWKYSEGERQFASYMQLIHPHLPLQSTFTSNLGAPRLNGNGSKMRSDGRLGGVNCANSIEIEFMGDFHHHANKSTFPPFPTKLEDFDFTHSYGLVLDKSGRIIWDTSYEVDFSYNGELEKLGGFGWNNDHLLYGYFDSDELVMTKLHGDNGNDTRAPLRLPQ